MAPDVPEPLERVVFKALAKRPADRYQSAEEMLRGLLAATEEAGIALPDRISLPLSFTTDAAPSEAVAVLSGTARDHVTDAGFADDETDVTLDKPSATVLYEKTKVLERGEASARKIPSLASLIFGALAFIFSANLILLTLALLTGNWALFQRGWPVEFFLVSCGLCFIMLMRERVWLLFPTLLIFGNGLMFALTALTGWWRLWNGLWILEIWLLIFTVGLLFFVRRQSPARRCVLARVGGLWGIGVSWLLILAVPSLAVGIQMFSGVVRFFFG